MSSRRSRSRQSSSSSRITDDQIIDLISKLQALLPEAHTRNNERVSAGKILQDTCNYIRSLHQEVDDLSERLSELLATTGTSSAQAAIIRSLFMVMSSCGYIVEVTNLSSNATERDVYDFFSFSGAIEHIEIIRSGDYASTAYVTFKEPHALETAVLLSGATIVDQRVCITRWGQNEDASGIWDRPSWRIEDDYESTSMEAGHFKTTPREAVTMAQEVVTTMLSKGYILSKDALSKAKAFDESHRVSATAAAKVAELSKRIGLTDKVYAGVDAVRSVDERYHVSETTKMAVSATGKAAAAAAETVMNSSYFAAGALWLSGTLNKAAQATADLANRGSKN
ncbi:hypothetical protein J5N97_006695 [Dioscorea zingiberensis]|uniref:Uncharacterized protein n=1 Tax=Dioscorea zingiberensis TaxID=325984 RepID=A0A9D5HTI5_9LILI|nr:hypothetical protein J5N97_006695 [Dioscorea zingiberensis]